MTSDWENGLCEMDCGNCMASWFCPCFNFGRAASRMTAFPDMDEDKLSCCNTACFVHALLNASFAASCIAVLYQRWQVRQKFDIEGDCFRDCLVSFCCEPCATSQMNLELKKRAIKHQGGATRTGFMATAPMQHSLPDHALPTTALQPPEKLAVQQKGSVTSSAATPGMQHDLVDHPLPTLDVRSPEKAHAPGS